MNEYNGTWLVLFDDGRYLECYGTEQEIDEWVQYKMSLVNDERTYRKVKWDD